MPRTVKSQDTVLLTRYAGSYLKKADAFTCEGIYNGTFPLSRRGGLQVTQPRV